MAGSLHPPRDPHPKLTPQFNEKSPFRVVNVAPNGEAQPYFDKSRNVWVGPWRKPDGKVGRPTGKTRRTRSASVAHVYGQVNP